MNTQEQFRKQFRLRVQKVRQHCDQTIADAERDGVPPDEIVWAYRGRQATQYMLECIDADQPIDSSAVEPFFALME